MGCVLIGEGEAIFGGEKLAAQDALKKANLKPITLAAKEGLALTNGTTIMTRRKRRFSSARAYGLRFDW